jgi:hypothetical protein
MLRAAKRPRDFFSRLNLKNLLEKGGFASQTKRPKELRSYDCGEANGGKTKSFAPMLGSAKRPRDFFSRPYLSCL